MTHTPFRTAEEPVTPARTSPRMLVAGCVAVMCVLSMRCIQTVHRPMPATTRAERAINARHVPTAEQAATTAQPPIAVTPSGVGEVPEGRTNPSTASTPDPDALLHEAAERYARTIRSYRCTLWRRERIRGKLTPQQAIDVQFRESPRAIVMRWLVNPVQIKRCVYEAGRHRNRKGEECALVEPANVLARLCASKVAVPIHGPRARRSSRYAIDEFGFGAALDRILRVDDIASGRGELDLRVTGTGEIDGRPTWVVERRLPQGFQGRDYPDAKLIVHIDRAWLLPVAVWSYADSAGHTLLGSYRITNVRLNIDFGDDLLEF